MTTMGSIKNRAICDADCNATANAERVKEQSKIIANHHAVIGRLVEERDAARTANIELALDISELREELDRLRTQEQEGRAIRTTLINASTAGEPGTIAAALKIAGFYDLPAESDREWESSTARDVRISDIDNEAA